MPTSTRAVREAAAIHFDHGQSKYAHWGRAREHDHRFRRFLGDPRRPLLRPPEAGVRQRGSASRSGLEPGGCDERPLSKDIGFDSNRIGFGKRAGVVVVDFQRVLPRPALPLGGRRWSSARSISYGAALGGGAQGRPAGRLLLHPPIRARATRRCGRSRPWSTNSTTATPASSSTSASTIAPTTWSTWQDRAVDLLQHPGRHISSVKEASTPSSSSGCNTSPAACARASTTRVLLRLPRHRAGALLRRCRRRPAPRRSARRRARATPTSSASRRCSAYASRRRDGAMTEPRPFRAAKAQPGRHRR